MVQRYSDLLLKTISSYFIPLISSYKGSHNNATASLIIKTRSLFNQLLLLIIHFLTTYSFRLYTFCLLYFFAPQSQQIN